MKRDPKSSSMARTFLFYLAALAMGILIIVKAVLVQTKEGDELLALAEEEETRFDTLKPSRGNILACDGSLLAADVPVYIVGIDPTAINDTLFSKHVGTLSQKIAELFPKQNAEKWEKDLKDARKNNRQFVSLDPKTSLHQLRALQAEVKRLKLGNCINCKKPQYLRKHPYDPLAGRTIGYANAQRLVGLESAYDSILSGHYGLQKERKLHHEEWIPIDDENNFQAINGNDIVTTIDIGIQEITHQALSEGLITYDAEYGCAIVMKVSTGEIKAISNLWRHPTTNKCLEEYNYAVGVNFDPGSTFKTASMLVLLEDHPELNIDKRNINIKGPMYYGKGRHQRLMPDTHVIHDDGWVSIREIFEHSSNKGTSKLITTYYGEHPEQYINSLYKIGLNTPLGTGFSGEAKPFIKHPVANKNGKGAWSELTLPWMSIGYELALSPLQILTLYNAVANDGRMMKPMFVKQVQKEGRVIQTFEPTVLNEQIVSKRTIDTIQSMMIGVVERGTAGKLKGTEYGIAGKTGTAQVHDKDKKGYTKLHNTLFAGFFPAKNPEYSCIVVICKPHGPSSTGGSVAAPVFKEISDKVYATRVKGLIETPADKKSNNMEYHPVIDPLQHDPMRVPDVKGMNIADAVYLLENMGWSATFEGEGQVVQQSIQPGDSLKAGSVIKLKLAQK